MSKVKNVIIYVLSVFIAFETGLLVFIVSIFTALHDEKKDTKRHNQIGHSDYCKWKEEQNKD